MSNILSLIEEKAIKAKILYPSEISFDQDDINKTSEALSIKFSQEFICAYKIFPFDFFNVFPFVGFPNGVIEETLRLRGTAGLPSHTLYLSEDDASILLMKCLGNREEIYWIAIEDYNNYCENKLLEFQPIIFENFHEFFEYLLKSEEEIEALESSNN